MRLPYFATALQDLRTARADAEQLELSFQEKMVNWRKSLDEADAGMREQWMAVDLDDSAWDVMTLPQNWDDAGLAEFDGFVWFRTAVEIPAGWSGAATSAGAARWPPAPYRSPSDRSPQSAPSPRRSG